MLEQRTGFPLWGATINSNPDGGRPASDTVLVFRRVLDTTATGLAAARVALTTCQPPARVLLAGGDTSWA
jgi:hypothetical protein